jgi:hypothetical protein
MTHHHALCRLYENQEYKYKLEVIFCLSPRDFRVITFKITEN